MTVLPKTKLRALIGDHIPGGAVPAAWWITIDPAQLAAYDQWTTDYDTHREKVMALAASLGAAEARIGYFGKKTWLSGFEPPREMTLWKGHPDHQPPPTGWRVDSKSGYLVPSRRTKADRESTANRDFNAVATIPNVKAYLSGLPTEIHLPGALYNTQYVRGDQCILAFSGADPDRADRAPEIDTAVWQRQKLSALVALREDAA